MCVVGGWCGWVAQDGFCFLVGAEGALGCKQVPLAVACIPAGACAVLRSDALRCASWSHVDFMHDGGPPDAAAPRAALCCVLQGDVRFAEVMGLMGAKVEWQPYSITITGG